MTEAEMEKIEGWKATIRSLKLCLIKRDESFGIGVTNAIARRVNRTIDLILAAAPEFRLDGTEEGKP